MPDNNIKRQVMAHITWVDDAKNVRQTLVSHIEERGGDFQAHVAGFANDANMIITRDIAPDLLVTDVKIPDFNDVYTRERSMEDHPPLGERLVREMLARDAGVPVLVYTRWNDLIVSQVFARLANCPNIKQTYYNDIPRPDVALRDGLTHIKNAPVVCKPYQTNTTSFVLEPQGRLTTHDMLNVRAFLNGVAPLDGKVTALQNGSVLVYFPPEARHYGIDQDHVGLDNYLAVSINGQKSIFLV